MERTEIDWMPIGSIKPYEKNPRRNDDAVEAVANSIREFGFKSPIIVDKDLVIIAGHTRLKAAKSLGMKEIPVVIASDLSEEQVRAFRIADNSVADLSEWDYDLLYDELADIDLDMSDFGFTLTDGGEVDFEDLESRMIEKDQATLDFENKFKVKHTTDDCFTPPAVYDAVKSWALEEYAIPQDVEVVRPFYPGGDYANAKYPDGCIVLDNPPFSIMTEIVRFYQSKKISFFLFGQATTIMQCLPLCNVVIVGSQIVYENGASIPTSFVTNLGAEKVVVSADLFNAINDAQPSETADLQQYDWPDNVISGALLQRFPKYGISMKFEHVRPIKNVGESKVGIFGGGGLISKLKAEKLKAEKLKAEKLKAEKLKIPIILTPEEKGIIAELGKEDGEGTDRS